MTAIVNNFVLIASTLRNDAEFASSNHTVPLILNYRQQTKKTSPLPTIQSSDSNSPNNEIPDPCLCPKAKIPSYIDDDPLDLVLTLSEVGQHVEETAFARIRGSIETSVSHACLS